jgi:hypothetical protein
VPIDDPRDCFVAKAVPRSGDVGSSGLVEWITTVLNGRVDHGQDVLGRDIVHDGVDGGEQVAAARAEQVDDAPDLLAHLLGAATRQDALGIHCAAEDQIAPIAALQLC